MLIEHLFVSEGGRTSRIVGFSPPVSVGLVMEPNLVPRQSKVPLPNPFSQIAALPPWLPAWCICWLVGQRSCFWARLI